MSVLDFMSIFAFQEFNTLFNASPSFLFGPSYLSFASVLLALGRKSCGTCLLS